jgi:hypothetical protein
MHVTIATIFHICETLDNYKLPKEQQILYIPITYSMSETVLCVTKIIGSKLISPFTDEKTVIMKLSKLLRITQKLWNQDSNPSSMTPRSILLVTTVFC